MARFLVEISGTWALGKDQIWPDGDAPENPTADDVIAAMRNHSPALSDLIDYWNLRPTVYVDHKDAGYTY